jgi:hypothetical protein
MTVFNRPSLTVLNTLDALRRALPDARVVVVDDGSDDTAPLERMCREYRCDLIACDTVAEVPGCYHIDGYNNPAHAFNRGIECAEDGPVLIMSSDVIVQPKLGAIATFFADSGVLERALWTPSIIDMWSGQPLCSPQVVWPMPWCMLTTKRALDAVGRYDEAYCGGIAFEGNDVVARLALHVGAVVVDVTCVAFHQSHEQEAYSDDGEGWRRNEAYTRAKWGGVPFRPGDSSVTVTVAETDANGTTAYAVTRGTRMP